MEPIETVHRTLPEISVFYNKDDIKFALFQQSEVISDKIRETFYWNPQIINIVNLGLSRLADNNLTGTVLDIGSGFGDFSIPLAIAQNKSFDFVCFEPLDFLVTQFSTNKLLNCLNNIVIHQVGISNENETKDYPTIDPHNCNNHGSFSFADEYDKVRGIFNTTYNVKHELRTIDSYNFTNVRFVKISVNGYEKKVLAGMAETIVKSGYPPILIELWNDEFFNHERQEITNYLSKIGYNHIHKLSCHIMAFPSTETFNFFNQNDPESQISDSDKLELQNLLKSFEQSNNEDIPDSNQLLHFKDHTNLDNDVSGDEFLVVEKLHDAESTIENQQIYKPD